MDAVQLLYIFVYLLSGIVTYPPMQTGVVCCDIWQAPWADQVKIILAGKVAITADLCNDRPDPFDSIFHCLLYYSASNVPGCPSVMGLICVLGSPPKAALSPQNNFTIGK